MVLLFIILLALVFGQEKRIVAVGDIHGDFQNALKVLKMAGVTDDKGKWIGGNNTTLVQTGDILDRGPDTIRLYNYFMQLQKDAESLGGEVVVLLGNHELMNLEGDVRYVSSEEEQTFGSKRERKREFSKNGEIGKFILSLNVTKIIDGTIFVHGGISAKFSKQGADKLNTKARKYLKNGSSKELKEHGLFQKDTDGPLWYRGFYKNPGKEACSELQEVLKNMGARRMVMGHTITESKKIESHCHGQAYFIDVGISSFYEDGSLAALELTKDSATSIYPKERRRLDFIR
ncbi:hypothetical protein DSO57_1038243 [Entomophthora muscae]|uniref:Uncharacterized protein n=1 Tax=Entomophthora muscae TaxID=34485 RepID=A0ACC2U8G2_9FUNG|nr:hypothetical protein DSO57_1038243 [Entomophthora muscae]